MGEREIRSTWKVSDIKHEGKETVGKVGIDGRIIWQYGL
jgi:hypothetical protein